MDCNCGARMHMAGYDEQGYFYKCPECGAKGRKEYISKEEHGRKSRKQ